MKRIIHFFVVVLFCCAAPKTWAQVPTDPVPSNIKLPNFTPHSPDMASLGKFGNIPVSMFTGVPSINVPIYEFHLGSVSVPITLSYHASGLKVEEMASNVGLDWALTAGGTISCEVRGLPDFDPGGYCANHGVYAKRMPDADYMVSNNPYDGVTPNLPVAGGELYAFSESVSKGEVDAQPDIYTYNFPGHSGKFYFDEFVQAHTMPLSTVKIEIDASKVVTITDENGIKYTFGEIESTVHQNSCTISSINSSWWLSQITLPNQQKIKLNYQEKDYSYPINPTYTRNRPVPNQPNIQITECQNPNNMVDILSKRLVNIVSSTGDSASFIYDTNDRIDLPGANSLNRIQVFNGTSQLANFSMNYSYTGGRLRLERVINTARNAYSFTYNASSTLPLRSSFAMDHWGYYNGQVSNQTLAPMEPQFGYFDGANREPDFNYAKTGVLTKVTWPTGGSTSFDYEPNDYYYSGQLYAFTNKQYGAYSNSTNSTVNFTIPSSAGTLTQVNVRYDLGGAPPLGSEETDPPCLAYLTGPMDTKNNSPEKLLALGLV